MIAPPASQPTAPHGMRRSAVPAAVRCLLLVGLTAAPLVATRAQAPKVYFACYVPSSGSVYRIKENGTPQQCSSSVKKGETTPHIEFTWTDGAGAVRATDAAGGDLTGVLASPTVAKLLGRALSTTPPVDGQVLTWNQAANTWEPKAPSQGGGQSDHGALAGLGDDDHSQYLLAGGDRVSPNGFAVTGTLGVGTMPATGDAVRFMWYPAKAALRVGQFLQGQSSDANIGLHSIALGKQSFASGEAAVALGGLTTASGAGSAALSGGAALGASALAVGSAAIASGFGSRALGAVSSASGDYSTALGAFASTNGKRGAFVYGDASTMGQNGPYAFAVVNNQFVVRAAHFWFGNHNNVSATLGRYIETSTGAYLSSGGAWTNSSDSTRKTDFRPVNGDSVLAKLASIPIRTWSYIDEDSTVRHIGPTAQAFRATFGLGQSETAIATVDADGVSLVALQALLQRTNRLERENATLDRSNADLRSRLDTLDERLRSLEAELAARGVGGVDTSRRR